MRRELCIGMRLSPISISVISIRSGKWLLSLFCGVLFLVGAPQSSSSRKVIYLDTRERVAASLTFEWVSDKVVTPSLEFVQRQNEITRRQIERLNIPPDQVKFIDESIANQPFFLSDYYIIKRTSQRTLVRCLVQMLSFPEARVVQHQTDTYFLGDTIAEVTYGSEGDIMSVDLSKVVEKDVWGVGTPMGSVSPAHLIFFAGISPLRLAGGAIDRWRLRSVTPETWVFVLAQQEGEEYQPEIEIHLDRRYQDAPARLEIRYPDGEIQMWRTLKYKRIEGVWFPSEVEYSTNSAYNVRSRYTLVRTERTKSVELEIPEGARIFDRRRLGDAAWDNLMDFEESVWKPGLLDEKESKGTENKK
jgi:hypothetical protein